MGDPAANRPNSPPLFPLPSSISHPSCILCTESSESFSCILYTECSESSTAASLAPMLGDVRITKNNDSSSMPPFLEPTDPPRRVQEIPTSLINPPDLRAATSHESMVLLISKHLRRYLRVTLRVTLRVGAQKRPGVMRLLTGFRLQH